MSFDADSFYRLLPAIYRLRDAQAQGPLRELLEVIAGQALMIEENLEQLYDDQFIETCAEWAVPYLGDLVAHRGLHGVVPRVGSPRAEVANTISYRRRKGTASVLEQLARDVTGWPAHVVEFFERLAATQYMNHLRPRALFTPDLRRSTVQEFLAGAFDEVSHTVDVRPVATARGRYNIPNVAVFLWRIQAYPLEASPARQLDDRRFVFSPLGHSIPLYTAPADESDIASISRPIHVPLPISRRAFDDSLRRPPTAPDLYYGSGNSVLVVVDGVPVPVERIDICDLEDAGGGAWAHMPDDRIVIDPELGRLAFPADEPPPGRVDVSFHYGFSADIGGGQYVRGASFVGPRAGGAHVRVPDDWPTIQLALNAIAATGGVVEITDNARYSETLAINAAAGAHVDLRAAERCRPFIELTGDFEITGADGASVSLNGLLIGADAAAAPGSPGRIRVPAGGNLLRELAIRHCTLVPGLALDADGRAHAPGEASIVAEIENLRIVVASSIVGALRVAPRSALSAQDSFIDANDPTGVAFAAPDGAGAGARLRLEACTVIGKVASECLEYVSDTILWARKRAAGDAWPAPVWSERRQEGCVRFSFVPPGSITPRRYRCQPDLEVATQIEALEKARSSKLSPAQSAAIREQVRAWLVPGFTSQQFGTPAYGQLLQAAPLQIRRGAHDESEMGAFHLLYQPQRETNLRVRLEEYLRFGLEAGFFYAS